MANRYWVGGSATWNLTATAVWSTTSGGAGGASVPTIADNVFFTAASGNVDVTIFPNLSGMNCAHINCVGFTGLIKGGSSGTTVLLIANGSLTLGSGMRGFGTANSLLLEVGFRGANRVLTTNGIPLNAVISIGVGSTVTAADNITTNRAISILATGGSFTANSKTLTMNGAPYLTAGSTLGGLAVRGNNSVQANARTLSLTNCVIELRDEASLQINTTAALTMTLTNTTFFANVGNVYLIANTGTVIPNLTMRANTTLIVGNSTSPTTWAPTITTLNMSPRDGISFFSAGQTLNIGTLNVQSTASFSDIVTFRSTEGQSFMNVTSFNSTWGFVEDVTFINGGTSNNTIDFKGNSNLAVTLPNTIMVSPVKRN